MMLVALLAIPLVGIWGVLLARQTPRLAASAVLATALASLVASASLWRLPPQSLHAGGWVPPLGIPLAADALSMVMLTLTGVIFTAAAFYHWGETLRGAKGTENTFQHLAFPLLLLGLNGLFITADLFNFYVFFELIAVASFLLVATGKRFPFEAAWKYSAQSVVGSICLLMGVVLLYSETGTLAMAETALRLSGPAYVVAPFFLLAFLLKGAIFPFHFWQPDAHAAATTAGSMVLAGLLIKVGLYGVVRLWPLLMGHELLGIFVVLGAGSLLVGAWAAFSQADAKRMLGFSSVSQLGLILLAVGWGTPGAWATAVYLLVAHSLAKALLFAATGLVADRAADTRFATLTGAGAGAPLAAAAFGLGAMSLVGLPPTAGFFGKLGALQAGAGAGAWLGVAVVLLGSLLTLAYSARAYRQIFWVPGGEAAPRAGALATGATVALAVGVVVAGAFAGPLWLACEAGVAGVWPAGRGW